LNNQCPGEREREQDQVVRMFVSTANAKVIGPMNVEIGDKVGIDLAAEIMADITEGTLNQDQDLPMVEEEVDTVAEADPSEKIADLET